MKIAAIILIAVSFFLALVAVNTVWGTGGENRPEKIEDLVGYAVGAFLPAMVCLIVGVALWSMRKKHAADHDEIKDLQPENSQNV